MFKNKQKNTYQWKIIKINSLISIKSMKWNHLLNTKIIKIHSLSPVVKIKTEMSYNKSFFKDQWKNLKKLQSNKIFYKKNKHYKKKLNSKYSLIKL
jgi:hypothetical protein